jgi:biopolymer transport protein ExbB/TolQ
MEHIAPFTPIGLFLQAGPVAKAVLALLLAASIWCWMLIVEAMIGIGRLKKAIHAARASEGAFGVGLLAPIIAAGYQASALAISGESAGEARIRIADCMQRAAQTLLARVEGNLPNLAVISSVAPFIGLFGTVWGIMISFSSVAESADTSLAVVAPGIAEALAATAVGLAAAIPATIGYNRLGSSLARAAQQLQQIIDECAIKIMVARSPTPEVR